MTQRPLAPVGKLSVEAYDFPIDPPHSDGTASWSKITLVVVEAHAGNRRGIGYTYADHSTAKLIHDILIDVVQGQDAFGISRCWDLMVRRIRNLGRPGIASMAISAVDSALWDLKAKLLDLPLVDLLGMCRDSIEVYGSGGLTSASAEELEEEFGHWLDQGVRLFKMKIGREPQRDLERIKRAREIIDPERELFVDANGAYVAKEALKWAYAFSEYRVSWFEEPVSSDDLDGLKLLREAGPPGMSITAGEYGYDLPYFRRMLEAGAVDILQADASRCAGITGFLAASALCQARGAPLSSHTAPSLHAHLCCAAPPVCHLEYFGDHARIEKQVFDGFLEPLHGRLIPDRSRPGLGIELKRRDAARLAG